eukprot:TRINITY_DN181_c0_g1_i10.p1 TRINITY_DN181_c0_g1~~TRINITY_DN181_c0_g1_i10.p1  ORF type:complete len:1409 (-),score=447.00 TRINITY_DN181_c0_g1_i10:642-4868(-)
MSKDFVGLVLTPSGYTTTHRFLNVGRNSTITKQKKLPFESFYSGGGSTGSNVVIQAFSHQWDLNQTFVFVNVFQDASKPTSSVRGSYIVKFDASTGNHQWISPAGYASTSVIQLRRDQNDLLLYAYDMQKAIYQYMVAWQQNFTAVSNFGTFGVAESDIFDPRSFFVNRDKELYIGDTGQGTVKIFSPSCLTGYYGRECDQVCPGGVTNPCNNRGECGLYSGLCTCNAGFFGKSCEKVSPYAITTSAVTTPNNLASIKDIELMFGAPLYLSGVAVTRTGNMLLQVLNNLELCKEPVFDENAGPSSSGEPANPPFQTTLQCYAGTPNVTLLEVTPTGQFVRERSPPAGYFMSSGTNFIFMPTFFGRLKSNPTTGDIFYAGFPAGKNDKEKDTRIYKVNEANQVVRTYNPCLPTETVAEFELDIKGGRIGFVCVTVSQNYEFSTKIPSPFTKKVIMLTESTGAAALNFQATKNLTSFTFSPLNSDFYGMAFDGDATVLELRTAASSYATTKTLLGSALGYLGPNMGTTAALGAAPGAFNYPSTMLVTPDNVLVIMDNFNRRIQFLNATDGEFIVQSSVNTNEASGNKGGFLPMAYNVANSTLYYAVENVAFATFTTKTIYTAKVDCNKDYYGPLCKACPDTSCGGHGTCSDGRAGTGKCICNPSELYTGDSCTVCTNGHYKPNVNENTCIQCNAPNHVKNGACVGCDAGYFNDLDKQTSCKACVPGSFSTSSAVLGARECTPCSAGQFNNQTAATSCSLCPKGTFQSDSGLIKCQDCPEASIAPSEGTLQCSQCVTSRTNDASRTSCICKPLFFQKDKDAAECASCPEFLPNAVCRGGEDIIPRRGFWSAAQGSTVIYDCAGQIGCGLGDFGTIGKNCSLPGYTGPKCSVCEPGYQKEGVRCTKCAEDGSAVALIVLLILVTLVGITLLFRQKGGKGSILKVKILIGFLQMINQFTETYDVAWPESFKRLSNSMSFFNFNIVSVSSFDCANGKPLSFYAGLEFYFVLPLVFAATMVIGWFIMSKIKSMRGADAEELTGFNSMCIKNFATILLFLYPGISQKLLQTFKCVEVEGVWYLEFDYREECFNERHSGYVGLAVVGILLYIIGIPAAFILTLRKYKDELETQKIRERFGFLYIGYNLKTYYWEIVEMMRKLVIASVLVFVARGLPSQLVVGMLVNLTALLFHERLQPYEEKSDHDLQYNALLQLFMTLFGGLLLKVQISKEPNDIILFGVLLVLINLVVVVMAIVQVLLQFKRKYDRVMAGNPSLKEKGSMWAKLVKVLGAQAVSAMQEGEEDGDDDEGDDDNEKDSTVIEMGGIAVSEKETTEEEDAEAEAIEAAEEEAEADEEAIAAGELPEDEFEDKPVKKSKRVIPEDETEEERVAREKAWAEEDEALKQQEIEGAGMVEGL